MFGYGSKHLNVYLKIRAYCLQICTANDGHKMFKTINDSRNISPKEIILVSNQNLSTEYSKNNVWLWPEIFQCALKIKACLQNLCAVNCERITQVQHKMFKTIHNSVNISLTETILVSK